MKRTVGRARSHSAALLLIVASFATIFEAGCGEGLLDSERFACSSGSQCVSGYVCHEGFCERSALSMSECGGPRPFFDARNGLCLPFLPLEPPATCGEGQIEASVGGAPARCYTLCERDPDLCQTGEVCEQRSGYALCVPGNPSRCGEGEVEASVGGAPARCYVRCDTNMQACSAAQDCQAVAGAKLCVDRVSAGVCQANQRVAGGACVACPPGTTNAAGDARDAGDTTCDAVICEEDQRVLDHQCVPCQAGTSNDAGDDASGADTSCQLEPYALIFPGSFELGSPLNEGGRGTDEAQRQVSLTRAFWMKRTEVTQAEWQAVMGNNPSRFASCGGPCPVERVSWYDALEFLNRLSVREGREACYELDQCTGAPGGGCSSPTSAGCNGDFVCQTVRFKGLDCKGYRLPTEAEWEVAARAGDGRATYRGDLSTPDSADGVLDSIAWYGANSNAQTHPVAQKEPNTWGLYDVLGNVWEWCWDEYAESTTALGGDDPITALQVSSAGERVNRGGAWFYTPSKVARLANRNQNAAARRGYDLGFRAVRTN